MSRAAPLRARRRSPTAEELASWREYIETAEAVRRTLEAAFQETSGISHGDYLVMLALSESPEGRRRSSELAEAVGWERSRLSHHLRRMEERHLIVRCPVGDDARGASAQLTDIGAGLFRSSSAKHLHSVRSVFVDAFSADQLRAMRELTTVLSAHLEDQRARPLG